MKTTNELRRGNIVKVYDAICQVFNLDSCFVGYSYVGEDELCGVEDVKNVHGLKFTNEILSKIGSITDNGINGITWSIDGVFDVCLVYPESSIGEPILEAIHYDFRLPGGLILKRRNFLHEIQNLYYELSKKELEIKLLP